MYCTSSPTTTTTFHHHGGQTPAASLHVSTEAIAQLNNMGVACIEQQSNFADAGQCLQRALDEASSLTGFSLHCWNNQIQSQQQRSQQQCPAQQMEEVSKDLYIYQRGEYDEGMSVFSRPIALDFCASLHLVIGTIYYNLGQLCMRQENYAEATGETRPKKIT